MKLNDVRQSMAVRVLIVVALFQWLAGCAAQAMGVIRGGESAAYAVRNFSPKEIEQVRVVDAKNPDRWYDSASGLPANRWKPTPDFPVQMPSFGGNQNDAAEGHRVPDAVLISWREMPAPGAKPYTGELQGPHRVQVRDRVPKEVLAAARKRGFTVQLSFSAGQLPLLFHWKLSEYLSVSGAGKGIRDHCVGGDNFNDPTQKVYRPTYGSASDEIPIWSHCKLP